MNCGIIICLFWYQGISYRGVPLEYQVISGVGYCNNWDMNIYVLWEINFKSDMPVKKKFIITPSTLWQILTKTYCFLFWGCRAVRHEDSFWNSWHRTRLGSTWKLEHFDWNLKWKSVIESENGHWKVEMGVQSIKIKTTVNFLLRSCLIVYVWSLFNNLGFLCPRYLDDLALQRKLTM